MRDQELIVYHISEGGELLHDMAWLMSHWKDAAADTAGLLYKCIHGLVEMAESRGFQGNLWHCCLADLLANHENSYSRGCEMRGGVEGSINDAVLHDMEIFREFYAYDFTPMREMLHAQELSLIEHYTGNCREGEVYGAGVSARICGLAEELCRARTPEEMKDVLTLFYREQGVGKFGLHKSFRIVSVQGAADVRIEPIRDMAQVKLDDLVGYELQKKKLTDNTEAFVSGRKANNCLLFGDAGTGKSSCVKAIANEYYGRGLRVIEVYKHQLRDLHAIIRQVRGRNYRFIIFMDDLSFEDFEIEYKYLKAVIEGGLEQRPENVLIYATSNRRHLIRENYGDKEETRQDMHTSDTVQEKLSLAHRFGITIYFGAPDKKQFQGIVRALALRHGVSVPEEELAAQAGQWELSHGGLSGRTAQQFIDYVLGMYTF